MVGREGGASDSHRTSSSIFYGLGRQRLRKGDEAVSGGEPADLAKFGGATSTMRPELDKDQQLVEGHMMVVASTNRRRWAAAVLQ